MAITFPAPTSYIADLLRVPRRVLRLEEQQEYSGLGTGELLAADLAPQRWVGDIQTVPMVQSEANRLQARIEALDGSINAFYLYDPWKCIPMADPGGVILGASAVTINAIGVNNKSLRLAGLPAGYVLTEGDMLAFDYGSNPTRRALHRISETVTTAGTGITPLFEVRPHLRPGAVVGLAVILKKPAAKMIMVPRSLSLDANAGRTSISFQAIQTLS